MMPKNERMGLNSCVQNYCGVKQGDCSTFHPTIRIQLTQAFFLEIAFGEELEAIPGLTVEELINLNNVGLPSSSTDWSIYISATILGDDIICLGNCQGAVQLLQIRKASKEGLESLAVLQTNSRSKLQLLRSDKLGLAAADAVGKLWTWNMDRTPLLKGAPTGLHHRLTSLTSSMELTDELFILGFSNGALRLVCRASGSLYCDIAAHALSVMAIAFCRKSQMLLSVSEDSFIRIWQVRSGSDGVKLVHLQNEVVEDMLLCGVQFLSEDGNRFGVVGYDRNELVVYNITESSL